MWGCGYSAGARVATCGDRAFVAAGANFFNLSPRETDGKYQKKAVAMMLHIVFKVAKTMAPSVIFIDEVEKVFLSDKKKLKEFSSVEPYNRIKKELAKVRPMLASVPAFSAAAPGCGGSCMPLTCLAMRHGLERARAHELRSWLR